MSPTCSSRFLVGKNALSATARTNYSPSVGFQRVRDFRQHSQPRNVVPGMKLMHAGYGRLVERSGRRWYGSRALSMRALVGLFVVTTLGAAGCGGGGPRQD